MTNEKHIFIGLGGSGCQTITQIKEKVYANRYAERTATKSRLEAMNETYRFIFLDTDQRDIDSANKNNRKSFEEGRVPFINPQSDLVNLGEANPSAIYYEAKQAPELMINKRILEACSPELSAKIPDQPLGFGAGAFRMKSRIAFAHSLSDFQTKLQSCISALNDVRTVGGQGCTIFYWVVCSTNGGTGSGIINDVLYHINQMHKQVVGNGDPQLILTMYMPKVYIDYNSTEDKYALNAFAVFKEIQAFKEMSLEKSRNTVMHRMAFLNDYNLVDSKRSYCPFYYLIPIDIQTDKGTSLGNTRTMYRNTAEMLYLLHSGIGGETFRSDIDNYMHDIMERDHENFLVPMGYVQLHKPTDQFNNYFKARFERDLLRYWLINPDDKRNQISDLEAKELENILFKELDATKGDTIAKHLMRGKDKLTSLIDSFIPNAKELESDQKLDNAITNVDVIKNSIKSAIDIVEKRTAYKKRIVSQIWEQAEQWTKEIGLIYAINAIDAVHENMKRDFSDKETALNKKAGMVKGMKENLEKSYADADKIGLFENNSKDVEKYRTELEEYFNEVAKYELERWQLDMKKDFCNNDKNDELSKLKGYLLTIKDAAMELNEKATKYYDKLSVDFGNTALDVTTVYLPMLKNICNGNGWKPNNFFSRCYKNIINAEDDKEETPDRDSIYQLLREGIFESKREEIVESLLSSGYIFSEEIISIDSRSKQKEETCRFFANPKLEEKKPETILEEFICLAQRTLERNIKENTKIQDSWANKKVSSFFHDLPNDEKEEVRRSLSPALFFNYNTNRIEVAKKEEHLLFVAPDEDLAHEMLGYEGSNNRHRFVRGTDSNSALVLKSKYGLSLQDYRPYDSIEGVYSKAEFREKYHFHHSFAQFLDKITLNDLPDDIMNQHKTFAKMLLLKEYEADLKPLFYVDPYDTESYVSSMYITDPYDPSSFEIARPEAFCMQDGLLCIKKEDRGCNLFDVITGVDFAEQFENYFESYYNHRYGETLDKIMQEIIRQRKTIDGVTYDGQDIIKKNYITKRDVVLKQLSELKQTAKTEEEKRLYNIFFNIVRNDFKIVSDFIG